MDIRRRARGPRWRGWWSSGGVPIDAVAAALAARASGGTTFRGANGLGDHVTGTVRLTLPDGARS